MNVPAHFGIPEDQVERCVVPNVLERLRDQQTQILDAVDAQAFDPDMRFAIKLSLEEALVNAYRHGNRQLPDRSIHLHYFIDHDRVAIMVADEGDGFCPEDVPDPTLDENLDRPFGRGVMLMQSYMTEVHFNDRGNCVWMLKIRHAPREDE